MNQSLKVRRLVEAAMIAAIYTVLTYAAAALNLAYQGVQFRFSEALTILPVFTPSAIPGLAIGCFLSNLGSPMGIIDWISGTSATLLAAVLTRLLRNLTVKGLPVLAPFPPVLTNAVIVGCVIAVTDPAGFSVPLFAAMAQRRLRRTGSLLWPGSAVDCGTEKNRGFQKDFSRISGISKTFDIKYAYCFSEKDGYASWKQVKKNP